MADGLQILGVDAQATADGMIIQGNTQDASFSGGTVNSHDDHRIAMAFAMASLRASDAIHIDDCDNVNTSFPGFAGLATSCGLSIQVINE
jgi:3-phosphoshikimate 1-carboxyvinyltransferase